jgi:hypothetical protein
MPNLLTQNPIEITTAMATKYKTATSTEAPAGLGSFTYLLIEKVYWMTPVTIGDTVSITDPDTGNVLLNLRCEVAGQSQIIDWTAKPKRWRDFIVGQISSGTLWIYTA